MSEIVFEIACTSYLRLVLCRLGRFCSKPLVYFLDGQACTIFSFFFRSSVLLLCKSTFGIYPGLVSNFPTEAANLYMPVKPAATSEELGLPGRVSHNINDNNTLAFLSTRSVTHVSRRPAIDHILHLAAHAQCIKQHRRHDLFGLLDCYIDFRSIDCQECGHVCMSSAGGSEENVVRLPAAFRERKDFLSKVVGSRGSRPSRLFTSCFADCLQVACVPVC